jgi:hypothetical protein
MRRRLTMPWEELPERASENGKDSSATLWGGVGKFAYVV